MSAPLGHLSFRRFYLPYGRSVLLPPCPPLLLGGTSLKRGSVRLRESISVDRESVKAKASAWTAEPYPAELLGVGIDPVALDAEVVGESRGIDVAPWSPRLRLSPPVRPQQGDHPSGYRLYLSVAERHPYPYGRLWAFLTSLYGNLAGQTPRLFDFEVQALARGDGSDAGIQPSPSPLDVRPSNVVQLGKPNSGRPMTERAVRSAPVIELQPAG